MIVTEEQRRWWFATHPEYSWSRTGQRIREHHEENRPSGLSPSQQSQLEAIQNDYVGLISDPRTALDLFPYRGFIKAPSETLKLLLRSTAQHTILNAVKRKTEGGPGKWVEVGRSRTGLEHQSKMSGQPIRERGGKYYINEYELNGVKFDDYRNGKLYEYKGPQGNLLNRDGLFYDGIEGALKLHADAVRQANAARGIPVIWKVGANQVKAFKRAVGDVRGIVIVP